MSDFGQITAKNNVILTGQNASISSFNSGKLDLWYKYDRSNADLGKFADESDDDGTYDIFYVSEPIDFKLIDKLYSWAPEALNYKTISAGNNVVLDFKNAINLESKLPSTEKPIAKIVQVGNPSFAVTAKNIILNSNNINISTNLQSENDLSIIAGQNINIHDAQLVAKQSQSLIANNDLNLKQVNLTAKDSTLISKNGNLQYSLNPVSAFKDNVLSPPVINAANSLHIQAGKNISFDNAQLTKTNKLTFSANDNIVIRRDELNLMKLAASEPAANINALLTKTGNWASSGEINLTAGKSIEAHGIAFNSGKSLMFNAGQDILLGSKAIKDVDNVFKTHRYPELRSQLIANGNITLNAARDIDLQSANLQSKDKIIALSGRDIKLTATAYSAIPNSNEDNQDVRYVTSTLSGDKGVTLASNGALTAQGSTIKSLNDITLSSGGNVRLESVKTNYRKQSGKTYEELYRQIGTEINSGKTLTILSEGSILFQASRLIAKGAVVGALAAELAAITLNSKLFEPKYLNEQERQLALVQDAIKGNEAKTQFTKVLGGLAGALITHKPEGAFSAANSAELVYTYNYTEHQLQQIIIENNLDMMAAAKGDKAAAKRVTARQEAAIFVGFVAAGGYVAVIGGEIVLAASPEILAAAKLGMQGCKAGLVLCINKLAISSAEVIAPETAISSGAALGAGYKLLASSEEAAKALASTTMNSSKHMLMAGKQDASKLKSLLDAEKLRVEANKKVIEEINKFSSKNKARDTATMVAAYDIKSGTIIVKGSVGNKIEADMLHKDTITLLKKKLGGADVGTKTIYCNNIVGGCGEVLAADQLIRQGVKPTDIRISQAYRPRDAHGFDISEVPPEALVSTCKNCIKVFVE